MFFHFLSKNLPQKKEIPNLRCIYKNEEAKMKKNIIVRQQDLKDCGVCSLLSIIKYYGGYIPLEKLRQDTHTSLEGTTAYHLVKTARNYGFDAYGMKLEKVSDLENNILPIIAHVEINHYNHFLVVYKVSANDMIVMDPAKGKIKISKNDFESIWSGNIITLYPKHQLPKIINENHLLELIKEVFKKEKKIVLKILFLTSLLTFVTIITGFYFKVGMNFITDNEEKTIITTLIFFFMILYAIKELLYYLRNHFKNVLNKNLDGYLYNDFLHHLFLLPNYFMKDRTTGEIMVRIKELANIKEVFSEILITILLDSILAFSVGIILFHIHKTLFFLLCLFVFTYVLFGIIFGKIIYKKALSVNETDVDFESIVVENIDSFISLKNLNLVKKMLQKMEMYLFKYLEKSYDLKRSGMQTNSIAVFLEEFMHFVIISFGLYEILKQNCSLINLITFESLISFFFTPFKTIINLIPNYNYVKVGIEKINDFYNVREEQDDVGLKEFQNGDIVVEDLNFSYNDFSKLFTNFHLEIKEKSCVMFKGNSGCGKSTLCQMLSRLLEVKNNNIKIGNVSINDYSLDTIRKNITYVSQKENLMQDTIKNNILLGREILEEKYLDILSICEIESIVLKKPLRYETFLPKDSINISGGEKQRIILARALLNDFQILILDEALSEVNSELEISIIKKLKAYFKDKTIIYVSHKNHGRYFDTVYDFGELLCKNI